MADQAKMNGPSEGVKFIDTINPDDPEYVRQMQRPAEIKEDVKQMDNRKRVQQILNSQAFRDELELIISEQLKTGTGPVSVAALQQISELLLPHQRLNQGNLFSKVAGSVIPVADIKGVDSLNYERGEKILRNKVASCYRLIDIFGWSYFFNNLLSCRISQDTEHFLLAPYGLLAHEVTASSLVKVDMKGQVVDPGSTTMAVNDKAFAIHAAIHAFRPDLKCLVQLRSPQALAVASMKNGLVAMTPEAASLGEISYCNFLELADNQEQVATNLGPRNKVLVLTSFGVILGGESIEEAFLMARYLMSAAETQIALMSMGQDHLLVPSEEVLSRAAQLTAYTPTSEDGKKKWRRGELEFEALMRHLDSAGFRTNHLYREPQVKRTGRPERSNSEIEIPPATSSHTYDEDGQLMSPLRLQEMQRKAQRVDWLNTPNRYAREEIAEVGTPNPKKITKWVPENTPGSKGGSAVRLEGNQQFAPQGADPKELKAKHQAIRKEYYEEKIDAGPQSRILEGITWDEAQKMKEGQGDSVIVVGAVSKGIIQKDHRHNVQMYKTSYAPNPFDNMSEDEINRYKQEVTGQSGENDELHPGPDGKLISTEERMLQIRQAGQPEEASPREEPQSPYDDPANRPAGPGVGLLAAAAPTKKPGSQSLETDEFFNRSQSFRQSETPSSPQREAASAFPRSKSERKPKKNKKKSEDANGEQLASPTKSMSSGDGTLDERSSREGSPSKEVSAEPHTPEKGTEKKKKKFRMPSFNKPKKRQESSQAKPSLEDLFCRRT